MIRKSRHTRRLRAPAVLSTTGNSQPVTEQVYREVSVLADNAEADVIEARALVILAALGAAQ